MKIYINARFLTQPITGVQRYAVELVKYWDQMLEARAGKDLPYDFVLLLPAAVPVLHQLTLRNIVIKRIGVLKGHAWEQLELPFYARDGWLVNLCNTGPLAARKQIATIHDTAVFEHPQAFTFAFRNAYKLIQNGLGRRARRIITVSEFSKGQLIRHCGVKAERIRVVSLGREHMQALESDERVYAKHGLTRKRYILAVSSMNPYKNFAGLTRALAWLKDRDYDIVIAGAGNAKVFGAAPEPAVTASDPIKWIGYVTDEELKALFEGAACFVFPSYYEGFGLPPLEAMTCGTPILVSRAASMPEVCGEACLYFDPHDPQDIAAKIQQVMTDETLRHSLQDKGCRRSEQFSWERCATQTMEVIKEVARR